MAERRGRRGWPGLGVALALAALPGAARAHASERMVILTLPTGPTIVAAAATVGVTALLLPLAPRLPGFRAWRVGSVPLPRRPWGSWLAAVVLAGLLSLGWLGPRDPLENLLPLTVWVLVWVGMTLLCLALGDLWAAVDPWSGPVAAARRALGWGGSVGLGRLGHWPAVAGLFGFAWFELVSPAPDDPAVLARAVLVYWLAVFALAVLEGPGWLRQGEALTVYFGLVARIAPLWWRSEPGRLALSAGLPGAQLLAMPPLAPSAAAFVTLVLATLSFDGLRETFAWVALIGVNPLEFPGRSAVRGANTLGLLLAWGATAAAILGTVALGRRLDGQGGRFWPEAAAELPSFLPIAAGYHVAHYLVALAVSGRYALAALNDPLGRGWSLLGLPEHWVSLGFLSDPAGVRAIWSAQVAVIVAAHLLAVVVSVKRAGPRRAAARLPMAALMVGYTVFGLWLLSTATVG